MDGPGRSARRAGTGVGRGGGPGRLFPGGVLFLGFVVVICARSGAGPLFLLGIWNVMAIRKWWQYEVSTPWSFMQIWP